MQRFEYTAQSPGGAAISGTIDAPDGVVATQQLGALGLRNVEMRESGQPPASRPLGGDDFIFFNEQLAALASTGVCLDTGLRQLGKDVQTPRLRRVLDAVADDLTRGQPLDEALARHAQAMPELYARVVRAGVQSGQLSATLLNLSQHLRLMAETRRLVAEALTYPAVVLVLAIGVLCAVLMIIVPQFGDAIEDFGVQLPALTVMMIALAGKLMMVLLVLGLGMVGLAGMVMLLRFTKRGRLFRERLIAATPALGSLVCHSLRTRFLRAMAFAVDSGLPLPEALRLSAGATGSELLTAEAERVADRIERGESMLDACRGSVLIPAMFAYLAEAGRESGCFREALVQLASAFESRAAHAQSMLRGWLAPLAVLGVGLVIGLIILALFMPLVSMIQSVSG